VVALVNAATGAIAAQYEYGPFGELIRATGPMARANPFRFSTNYQGCVVGFVEGAVGNVLTKAEPLKNLKQLKPFKSLTRLPPIQPLVRSQFSDTHLNWFLNEGSREQH
jgi:hypothetical protein